MRTSIVVGVMAVLLLPVTAPCDPPVVSSAKAELMGRVEDFLCNNFRDITARETIEWGPVEKDEKGNSSIRYKYLATIWDKDKKTTEQVFTFDPKGEFVSVKDIKAKTPESAKP